MRHYVKWCSFPGSFVAKSMAKGLTYVQYPLIRYKGHCLRDPSRVANVLTIYDFLGVIPKYIHCTGLITQANIAWYCIQHSSDRGNRKQVWTHKRHPVCSVSCENKKSTKLYQGNIGFCLGNYICIVRKRKSTASLITRCMGQTWGPSGADRTQVDLMLAPWNLLSGWVQDCSKPSALAMDLLQSCT